MSEEFSIKQILERIMKELNKKMKSIRFPQMGKKERYSQSNFFDNNKTSKYFPITKNTYYSYSAYVNAEKPAKKIKSMSLSTFYDICTYTNVSADYYLGFIETKRKEQSADRVRKEFGLSDKSMENLTVIKNRHVEAPGELSSYIINFILENDSFWNELDSLLPTYLAENYLKESSDYISRVNFELSEAFIHLIDDVCKSLLMVAADAEKNGFSIFDHGTKKERSYQSIIEEAQKRGWILLKNEAETVTE